MPTALAPPSPESEPLISRADLDALAARVSAAVPDAIEVPAVFAGKAVGRLFAGFGAFLSRGNVVDLAIGVIIGASFQSMVRSLVDDIFSPVLGLISGSSLSNNFAVIRPGVSGNRTYNTPHQASEDGAVALKWGSFVQTTINFLLVGLVLFLLSRAMQGAEAAKDALIEDDPEAPAFKECGMCLELVKGQAKACRHCGHRFDGGGENRRPGDLEAGTAR
ncbi:large-conductance mechanosensitive channel [Hyaloraphidium curvatum]|nr:large-conductance mechanosensitive channel [Hyaloraphidium curvatum]